MQEFALTQTAEVPILSPIATIQYIYDYRI
jgi:hypothetical protein